MKGIISMSIKETERVPILDRLMKKELKQKHAAKMLNLSVRQIQRLVKRYKRLGITGMPHTLRGTISNHRISEIKINNALEILRARYADFGITLAHEKLGCAAWSNIFPGNTASSHDYLSSVASQRAETGYSTPDARKKKL